MAQSYVVKRGDTLQRIAKTRLGDGSLSRHIAKFNGLRNPDRLSVGQRLELPGLRRARPASGLPL